MVGKETPCYVGSRTVGDIGADRIDCAARCHISADEADAKRVLSPHSCLLHAVGIGSAIIDIGSCYRAVSGRSNVCPFRSLGPSNIGWRDRPCDILGAEVRDVGQNAVEIIGAVLTIGDLKGIVYRILLIHAIPDDDRC